MKLWAVMTMVIMTTMTTSGLRMRKVQGQALKGVSVGPAGVWGVDSADLIYYRNGTRSTNGVRGTHWVQEKGFLVQLDVGENVVWGVNRNHDIYMRQGITDGNPTGSNWQQIPGSLKHVSVSPGGHVWGVNVHDNIYMRVGASNGNPTGTNWKLVEGKLRQISVGTVGVWGVNKHNAVYYRKGTYGDYGSEGTEWTLIGWGTPDKKMIYVSSAFGNVFGLSEDGEVHLRKGMSFANPKGTQWHHIRRRDNGLATVDSLHGYFWATKNKTNANAVLYSYLSRRC